VGYAALGATTVGNHSTALGYNAGLLTTGSRNTWIGALCGDANTGGTGNVGVGYASLTNSTGESNVAIGSSSGGAITSGIRNVCIGESAGSNSPAITTGNYNIVIGAYADTTSASSQFAISIGYDVSGAGGYTTLGQQTSDIRAAHGSTTWSTVSDERYKKDIVDSTAGLSFINALQPRTFNYRTLGELPETFNAYEEGSTEVFKSSQTQHGFIAQEIKAAIDADDSIKDGFKLWDDREDGSQEVAEAALIPVLVKAIQELSTQLDAALARIETLEG